MIEQDVTIDGADGAIPCFTVQPDGDGPFPAVILYMDAPGIREELRDFCRRIAGEGYFCLMPDMYYRLGTIRFETPLVDEKKREHMFECMASLNNPLVMADTEAMLGFLDGHDAVKPGAKGCVGYCMSGQYVVTAAGTYPDHFAASASLHGVRIVTDEPDSPHLLADRISGELYLGFASHDEHVPDNVIPDLQETLAEHGVENVLDIFPDTAHGFVFPARAVYSEGAAEESWKRLFDLYDRRLV
jgi:carboxymethylenebutenolidase